MQIALKVEAEDGGSARGVPIRFRAYETLRDGAWVPVRDSVPNDKETVRSPGGV